MLEANENNQKNVDLVNANAKHKIEKEKKGGGGETHGHPRDVGSM